MGLRTDAAVVNIEGNTKQLVDQINKADKAMKGFDATLTDILSHLTAVENGLKNVNSIANNANKITNSIQTRYNRETYDFGKQSKIVKSSSGFMSSDTGREKAFREYQKAVIKETQEITADVAERKRLRQQRANAETTTADAAKLRALKLEDQTSARYLARMDKLADARLLNAKNNQAGALYRDPRYQAGKAFSAVGNTISSWGAGGKAAGLLLDSLGAFVKSPVAGTAAAVSNLVKGVSELGKASTQAFAEIEAIKTQMGVVYSSQTQANSAFSEISQYAVKSPFGIQQTSELAILLKQSGVYASDLMDTLRMLGDTAGGNMEKMKRIANNYAQIMAIGKASMLDMRQFAYAGIPIFEAVSKELNVSQQELRKLISDGKVTSDIIEKVFKDLTGINGIFENATAKGAKTLKARLQNLSDARQLAYASIGEGIYNIGSKTGNDSYANRMVSAAENIWQGLHDWFDGGNIAKNVETIANRNNRIDELKQLIEYNKDNKEIKKLLEEELKEELSKRDVEKERATYVNSYDSKAGRFKNALDALNGYSIDDAYGRRANLLWKDSIIGAFNKHAEYNNLDNVQSSRLFGLYNELIKALKELSNLSEQDIQANRERNILQAQQLAYDQMNHFANARGSLNNSFQELSALYKSSDEYKAKEEKEHLATLKNALEVLKDIAKNTDESGRVDITKFSANQLASYIKQGAFTSGEKLDVVTGNKAVDSQNRQTLMNQYGYIAKLTGNFLKTGMAGVPGIQGTTYAQSFNQEILDSLKNLSDEQFFTEFPKIYEQQSNAINEMIKVAPKDGRQQQLETFKTLLDYALTKFEADTSGTGANPENILKGSKQEFIPLWKRILAGATGLSTQGMTGTLQTMENYKNDMAIRNMTSNVLKATMRSMGVDAAMGLVRTSGNAKQLRGDNGYTLQVDWQKTQESIKKFSLALSASTTVVTAYKNSLEQELDTYEQLIAAGYTQAESQDLKNQKTVSLKTLEKFSKDAGDQLVNAFGEGLMTKTGIKAFFNGSEFVDSQGNKLEEEEVIMTGNLFNFIKDQLPRIYNELHEANVAEAKNTVLNQMFSQAAPTQLASKFLSGNNLIMNTNGKHLDAVRFLQQYPDFANTIINSALETHKGSFPAIRGMSNTEILAYAYRTKDSGTNKIENDKIAGASAALENAFATLENAILDLVGTDAFENLKDALQNQARDEDVMKRYLANQWAKTHGLADQNSLTPENYGGARGLRNRLYKYVTGQELASDREDYIATKLRAEKDTVANINAKRLEARRAEIANNPNYQPKELELISEDDLNPLKKSNEELAKMLSYSERIALVWGEEGGEVLKALDNIGVKTGEIIQNFTASAMSSTLETWGKTLTSAATDSSEIGKNLAALSVSMLKNMGTMITQAGLSLAISSVGDKGKVLAGLAIAAAGGGLSFLGGIFDGATEDNNKEDDEWQKLLKIKQDLADLLKQAREDAIYYENTVRHKKAISANENFTKSVHDAIITPRGDVVTTDPKDYLIATKTPRTLVGGGAPTINFSVIDKSTGVKVTQQRSSYDERTNTIEFEAIIESKIQEVIATSKGDEAFAARESRLNGRTVIA